MLIAMSLLLSSAVAAEPNGPATVIDGNTVEVAGQRLRLFGIDAPDLDQTCVLRSRRAKCGVIARAALMDLTAGAELGCEILGRDDAGRRLASCHANDYDVAEGMVYTGWALALDNGPPLYAKLQNEAAQAKRGLWAGEFMPPAEWRKRR